MTQCVKLEENTNRVIKVTESDSEKWCRRYLGGGTWMRNTSQKCVGVDYIYYPEYNTFSPPQPYPSWTLNLETFLWDPPIPKPGGDLHTWNEETQTWVLKHPAN